MQGDAGLPTIEQSNKVEPIANTDAYGKSTIDGEGQGRRSQEGESQYREKAGTNSPRKSGCKHRKSPNDDAVKEDR